MRAHSTVLPACLLLALAGCNAVLGVEKADQNVLAILDVTYEDKLYILDSISLTSDSYVSSHKNWFVEQPVFSGIWGDGETIPAAGEVKVSTYAERIALKRWIQVTQKITIGDVLVDPMVRLVFKGDSLHRGVLGLTCDVTQSGFLLLLRRSLGTSVCAVGVGLGELTVAAALNTHYKDGGYIAIQGKDLVFERATTEPCAAVISDLGYALCP